MPANSVPGWLTVCGSCALARVCQLHVIWGLCEGVGAEKTFPVG